MREVCVNCYLVYCCCSVIKSCPTLCNPMAYSTPGFSVLHYLLEFAQTHSCPLSQSMPSNHLIFCHPLLLLPSISPSIRVFSNESALHIRWSKYWNFSFSFSISLSSEYSGLNSFNIDWFDLLAVQGTLKSLLQNHSSKASILLCSAEEYMVIILYQYMIVITTLESYHDKNSFPLHIPCTLFLCNVDLSLTQLFLSLQNFERYFFHPSLLANKFIQ